MPEAYSIEIHISGLPKTVNRSFASGWKARMGETRKWHRLVGEQILIVGKPKKPLSQAKLLFIRHSSVAPDSDNLCSSFKACCDALVKHGVLENDKYDNVGFPDYRWVKAKRNQGKIEIHVWEE